LFNGFYSLAAPGSIEQAALHKNVKRITFPRAGNGLPLASVRRGKGAACQPPTHQGKMNYLKLCFIGFLFMAGACQNDHEAQPQQEAAVITLTSPGQGDMFLASAPVVIAGTITAPVSMHGYEIILRVKTTNTVLFTAEGHGHGTTVSFQEQWINTVSSDTEVELEISAILDHAGNKTVKKITIHCHS
jgi:hypothetical protein